MPKPPKITKFALRQWYEPSMGSYIHKYWLHRIDGPANEVPEVSEAKHYFIKGVEVDRRTMEPFTQKLIEEQWSHSLWSIWAGGWQQ